MTLLLGRSFTSAVFILIVAHLLLLLLLQPLSVTSQSTCGTTSEFVTTLPTSDSSMRGASWLGQRFEVTPPNGIVFASTAIATRGQAGIMGLYSDQAVGGGQFLPGAPVAGAEQLTLVSKVAIPEFNISTINTYWASVHLPKGFYWLRFSSPNALSVSWHTSVNAWSPPPDPAVVPGISFLGSNDTSPIYYNQSYSFSIRGCLASLVSTVNSTSGVATPQLTFNLTAPTVQIAPKSESGSVVKSASVAINMARLSEMNGSTVVRSAVNITENGQWAQLTPNPELGSTQMFLYNATLAFDDAAVTAAQGRVEVQFDLFDRETNVSLGNLTAFAISPNFAKLTLRVFEWPFSEPSGGGEEQHRLEVRLNIDPPVSGVDSQTTGANGVTVFKLRHANDAAQRTTEIRVVNVVERDGTNIQADGAVAYEVNVAQSQLVLSFARFESSLVYDPDLGVLLGSKRDGESDGSDSTVWIIAVAVAVPVAVVFVVAVIVIGTVVGYLKHRRNLRHLAQLRSAAVNFESTDHRDADV